MDPGIIVQEIKVAPAEEMEMNAEVASQEIKVAPAEEMEMMNAEIASQEIKVAPEIAPKEIEINAELFSKDTQMDSEIPLEHMKIAAELVAEEIKMVDEMASEETKMAAGNVEATKMNSDAIEEEVEMNAEIAVETKAANEMAPEEKQMAVEIDTDEAKMNAENVQTTHMDDEMASESKQMVVELDADATKMDAEIAREADMIAEMASEGMRMTAETVDTAQMDAEMALEKTMVGAEIDADARKMNAENEEEADMNAEMASEATKMDAENVETAQMDAEMDMEAEQQEEKKIDYTIDHLPDSVMVDIFSYLPMNNILTNARLVCTKWYRICNDKYVWRDKQVKIPSAVSPEQLLSFVNYAKLAKLDLSACKFETKVLQQVLRACPRLKEVDFPRHSRANHVKAMSTLVKHCKKVKMVRNLNNDAALKKLVNLRKMESLEVLSVQDVTQETYRELFNTSAKLKTVILVESHITDETIASLVDSPQQLETFIMVNGFDPTPGLSHDGLANLGKLSTLTGLYLTLYNEIDMEQHVLEAIADGCKNLERLQLHIDSGSIHNEGLEYLCKTAVRLTDIRLSGLMWNARHLELIDRHCCSLKRLDVGNMFTTTVHIMGDGRRALEKIRSTKNVEINLHPAGIWPKKFESLFTILKKHLHL